MVRVSSLAVIVTVRVLKFEVELLSVGTISLDRYGRPRASKNRVLSGSDGESDRSHAAGRIDDIRRFTRGFLHIAGAGHRGMVGEAKRYLAIGRVQLGVHQPALGDGGFLGVAQGGHDVIVIPARFEDVGC